jgi:hypothetical protein
VGSAVINGQRVTELSATAKRSSPGSTSFNYWIDSTTYLPLRLTVKVNGRIVSQGEFHWLSATEANRALLNAPIPAGFIHRSATAAEAQGWGIG